MNEQPLPDHSVSAGTHGAKNAPEYRYSEIPGGPTSIYETGFKNAVQQSQKCFRILLDGFARPGRWLQLPDQASPAVSPGLWSIALTLFDADSAVWLSPWFQKESDEEAIFRKALRFFTECSMVTEPQESQFALMHLSEITWIRQLSVGDAEYPDRSATCIVELPIALPVSSEVSFYASGPGIKTPEAVHLPGFTDQLRALLNDNHQLYPLGVDFIFCLGNTFLVLPRSTRIEVPKTTNCQEPEICMSR